MLRVWMVGPCCLMHIAHPPTVKAWISHKVNARHITWSKSVKCSTELCTRCAKLCKRRRCGSCGYNNRRQSPLLRVNAGPDDRRCMSRWLARLRCFYSRVKSLIGKQVLWVVVEKILWVESWKCGGRSGQKGPNSVLVALGLPHLGYRVVTELQLCFWPNCEM